MLNSSTSQEETPAIVAWRGPSLSDVYTTKVDPKVRWYINLKDKTIDFAFTSNRGGERNSMFLVQVPFKTFKLIIQEFLAKLWANT